MNSATNNALDAPAASEPDPIESLLRSGLDNLEAGVALFDRDLCLILANRKLIESGDLPAELCKPGVSLEAHVRFRVERGDYGPGDAQEQVSRHLAAARGTEEHRIERVRSDGRIMEVRETPLPDGGFLATYTDVTERRQAAHRLEWDAAVGDLLHCVSVAVNEAEAPSDALSVILPQICACAGWQVGHIYVPSHDNQDELISTGIWYLEDPERFEPFRELSDSTRFRRGVTLVGRVMISGVAEWVEDISSAAEYSRNPVATYVGLRGAFIVPVMIGHSPVAVLEFYATQPTKPDPRINTLMDQIGTQLGRAFERWIADKELRESMKESEDANRIKTDFLANMSHELRTPLNGVLGMSTILAGTELTDQQEKYLDTIRQSGRALLTIIDDILDFARLDSGDLTLEPAPLEPAELVRHVVDTKKPEAAAKGLEISAFVSPEVPVRMMGDAKRLQQVLLNFVDNAIKFTANGSINVTVNLRDYGDETPFINFSVSDTGIGLSEHDQARVFDLFTQADSSATRTQGGTGLGLSISKQLCELMGGKIGVQSDIGVGSRFWFTVPLGGQQLAISTKDLDAEG